MPRTSSAALAIVAPKRPPRRRLAPSAGASPAVREVFAEVLAAVPAEHFKHGDEHLIEAFGQAVVLSRLAMTELTEHGPVIDGRQSPWITVLEKQHRIISTMAARLRLSPQHRADSRSAGRRADSQRPSIYDVLGDVDQD